MTTINFDKIDLSHTSGYAALETGYQGLNWLNIYAINPSINDASDPAAIGSGYDKGVTSGQQEAYTGDFGAGAFASATGGTFSLKSIEMTSAWQSKEKVEVQAFDANGTMTHDKIVSITDTGPTLVKFNWDNVNYVSFTAVKATVDPNFPGHNTQVVFDDIKLTNEVAGSSATGSDSVGTATHAHAYDGGASSLVSHEFASHLVHGTAAMF